MSESTSSHNPWPARVATILAGTGLLWLLYRIGLGRVAQTFEQLGGTGALFLFFGGILEAVFDALALREAALGRARFRRVLFLNQAGAALNTVVAGEAGEVLKASLLAKEAPGRAVSAILVWNVVCKLSKSTMILLSAAAAYWALPKFREKAFLALLLGGVGLLSFLLINVAIRRNWVSRLLTRLGRFGFLPHRRADSFVSKIREVEKTTSSFRHEHPGRYLRTLFFQIAARVAYVTTVWLALEFMGTGYSFFLSLLIFAITELAGFLLPLIPARVGVTEGSTYLLFSYLGLDGGIGVLFQLVMRIKQIAVNLTCLAAASIGRPKPVDACDDRPTQSALAEDHPR